MHTSKGKILLVNQSSGELFNKLFEIMSETHEVVMFNGISYKKKNTFIRLSTWTIYTFQLLYHLLLFGRKYKHILIVSNPPLATLVAPFSFGSYSFLLYDLYPNVLRQLKNNLLSNLLINIISSIWNILNLISFFYAKNIFTLSQSMADEIKLSSKNFFNWQSKIIIAPLWKSFSLKALDKKQIKRIKFEYGFNDKFVIGYSGNLGLTHPLELLVELASLGIKDLLVIIIGEGPKKKKLIKLSNTLKLNKSNIIFMDYLEKKDFQKIFSCFDLSVVALDKKSSSYSLPSKTITSLEFGKPILALASIESDLANLVLSHNCGIVIDPMNSEKLKLRNKLINLIKNENNLRLFSKNAKIALNSFSIKNTEIILERLIN